MFPIPTYVTVRRKRGLREPLPTHIGPARLGTAHLLPIMIHVSEPVESASFKALAPGNWEQNDAEKLWGKCMSNKGSKRGGRRKICISEMGSIAIHLSAVHIGRYFCTNIGISLRVQ